MFNFQLQFSACIVHIVYQQQLPYTILLQIMSQTWEARFILRRPLVSATRQLTSGFSFRDIDLLR